MPVVKNFAAIFLMVALVAVLLLAWQLFKPFAVVIVLSVMFTAIFYPVYLKLLKFVRSTNLASVLMCLLVVVCIILPIAGIIALLTKQSFDTYIFFENKIISGEFNGIFNWVNQHLPLEYAGNYFKDFAITEHLDIIQKVAGYAQNVSSWLVEQGAVLISSATSVVASFFLMLFTMFFLFKDGSKFTSFIMDLLPLPAQYEKVIFKKFYDAAYSVIVVTFLAAIIQGIIGGIGFWIAGIQPFIWGVAMAFFSLIPVVGTAIIWVPAVIILLVSGHLVGAIFLTLWGLIAISSTDNLIRIVLIQGKISIHPLIVFFSIIGGLAAFGFLGLLFGPLIVVIAATVLHIYQLEYASVLKMEKSNAKEERV
ncbi:MAG: AI-2E family transporter [Patescibacteria group bacterium]|nr:AI-2E family transporter [Patescibacteria group bacterium]